MLMDHKPSHPNVCWQSAASTHQQLRQLATPPESNMGRQQPLCFPRVAQQRPRVDKFRLQRCLVRKCSPASSGTHSLWDTLPECGTTPSCGWCVLHARKSGRSWKSLGLPRGRWHTGTQSPCRGHTERHALRCGSGCSRLQTLQGEKERRSSREVIGGALASKAAPAGKRLAYQKARIWTPSCY